MYPNCRGEIKNPVCMKIISDINNIELVIPEQQIGASYGDAFMADVVIGLFKSINEISNWVKIKQSTKIRVIKERGGVKCQRIG